MANIATDSSGGYYASQKPSLLKDFDDTIGKYGREALAQRYGDDLASQILSETRHKYEALIPQIPNVGGKEDLQALSLRRALILVTWGLALYKVLKSRGKPADVAGRLFYEMTEAWLRSIPGPLRYATGKSQFTRSHVSKLKTQA